MFVPTKEQIEAGNKAISSKELVNMCINDNPELARWCVENGVAEEIDED